MTNPDVRAERNPKDDDTAPGEPVPYDPQPRVNPLPDMPPPPLTIEVPPVVPPHPPLRKAPAPPERVGPPSPPTDDAGTKGVDDAPRPREAPDQSHEAVFGSGPAAGSKTPEDAAADGDSVSGSSSS